MLDIPSISGILAAIGVLVGVVLAILELRNITKTRQMGLIMSIYSLLATREFMDAWEKMRTREFKDYDGYVKKAWVGRIEPSALHIRRTRISSAQEVSRH